jgi:GNAT superfamily N-acetyltransferase
VTAARAVLSSQIDLLLTQPAISDCVARLFTAQPARTAAHFLRRAKPRRREGIGRALINHSVEEAKRVGFDAVMLNLVMERNPSRRLYADLGFSEIGRIPFAIGDQAAVICWRSL